MNIENKKKKVLIVSYNFPPVNIVGAVRAGKLAKYLPEFGWEPIVLTADIVDDTPRTFPVEINEANIVRIPCSDLKHLFIRKLKNEKKGTVIQGSHVNYTSVGWKRKILKVLRLMKPVYSLPVIRELLKTSINWYQPAVRRGIELIREKDADIIFSTAGGASIVNHFVASRLHKQTGIPWVADFRDLWSHNPYTSKTEPFHFFEKEWEKMTLKKAALLITVSEPMAGELRKLHSKETAVIPNGFDEADYTEHVPLLPRFTITYTGNIYPGKRDPSPLFQALAELRDQGKFLPDGLEVRFFGSNVADTISPLVEKYKVEQFVKIYGFVPFEQSVTKQKESTVLLLLSWNDPKDKGVYTGKVFEYIGAARPVLAIGMKGSVIDELLVKTGSGVIATEVGDIKSILVAWLDEFRQYGKISSYYHPDKEIITSYSRRQQAGKLAEIFSNVARH